MADVFDYIIVGGGTAGLTIAACLTENLTTTVLALEAGADHMSDLNVLAPGLFPAMYGNPDPPRTAKSSPTPAENSSGAGFRAINLMFWTHPFRQDIDGWGELGNAGWSWEELAPYLQNSKAFIAPSEQQTADMLLRLRRMRILAWLSEVTPRDVKALGGYVNLLNIDGATRSFASNAYLGPARQLPNLKMVTGVFVTNIVLGRSGGKVAATGVRWTKDGLTYEATAAREVVLAAGSIASPQLLEVSFIGDEKLLRGHGIEVFVDNPNVGENLQDHVYVPLGFATKPGVPSNKDYTNATYFQKQLDLYIQNKTGRLSSAGASSTLLSPKQIASTLDLERLSLGLKTGKTGLTSNTAFSSAT
ncbi:Dehydrogenase citC [Colletotrichum viniferum]|nr:Dehydrogenase citC [Colletotrichum viniferum]